MSQYHTERLHANLNTSDDVVYMGKLRDYFAGKAMQALLINPKSGDEYDIGELADVTYDLADAMLKARLK